MASNPHLAARSEPIPPTVHISSSTPLKHKAGPAKRLSRTKQPPQKERNRKADREMVELYVPGMPAGEFLAETLPLPAGIPKCPQKYGKAFRTLGKQSENTQSEAVFATALVRLAVIAAAAMY